MKLILESRRLQVEWKEADTELRQLPKTTNTVRAIDIEEAKKKVEELVKKVSLLNNDPERKSIPQKIKDKEAEVDSIKKNIEKINDILKDLRRCAEDQNKIKLLKEQVESDVHIIDEMKTDNAYLLSSNKVNVPDPHENDSVDAIRDIVDDFVARVEKAKDDLYTANKDLEESSSSLSKKSALLKHKKDTLAQQEAELKRLSKDDRGFNQIKNVIKNLRAFETTQFGDTTSPKMEPQSLSEYISKKITEVSAEIKPESKGNIIQKLKKMAMVTNKRGQAAVLCPCCGQKVENDAAAKFNSRLGSFVDALIQADDETAKLNRAAMKNYVNWRSLGKSSYVSKLHA